ncbi:TPA: Low molecular weight phosphotyrosine protein phosphatase, variant 3 [Trebouxia sp. C0004]
MVICCRCETASPSFWLGRRFIQILTHGSAEQVHTATGFPVPLPRYPWSQRPQASEVRQRILRQWASRQAQQKLLVAQRAKEQATQGFLNRERHDKDEDSLLQPVFRASPYIAEVLRAQRPVTQASILFLDEGNHCRSVLAEAVFKEVLNKSLLKPLIHVDSASIGPSIGPGLHDPRVMWAAQKAGLTLSRRNIRPFNETADIVNYDLVLTMDHFDYEEVYREVAVFDAMNPGGGYSNRVQQLGKFAATAGSQASTFSEDINDPLYGNSGGAQERVALLAAVHQLRTACRALLQKLMHLQARSKSDCTTLQRAIVQYLESNTRQPDKPPNAARYHMGGHAWRPVWRKNDLEEAGDFYTIRVVKGQRQVIKRRSAEWGYWKDVRNVRQEMEHWLKVHPLGAPDLLPSQSQLRRTGSSSLAFAITKHGGYAKLFAGMPAQHDFKIGQRKASGHWQDFEILKQELQPYLHPMHQPGPGKVEPDDPTAEPQRHCQAAGLRQQAFSKGKGVTSSSQQGSYKMATQQELMAAGRMDLLNAVRLWGGFTAVADRLGVLPNTRHKRSRADLRQEIEAVMREQHWKPGVMPSAGQLQSAGQHYLVAAIRQMGGFRTIAAKIGLTPRRSDNRGRPKKSEAAAREEELVEAAASKMGMTVVPAKGRNLDGSACLQLEQHANNKGCSHTACGTG